MVGYAKRIGCLFLAVACSLFALAPAAGDTTGASLPLPYRQADVLFAADGRGDAWFGYAIAAQGDTAAIGAPGRSSETYEDGGAYVFRRAAAGWAQSAFIPPPDGQRGSSFGAALALDGDTLAVAAPNTIVDNVQAAGAVYVYRYDGANWALQAALTPPDPQEFVQYGRALDLDGDTLLIATQNSDGLGNAVYVYSRAGNIWTPQATLTAPVDHTNYGMAVAIAGDVALVGAPGYYDDPAPYDRGAVYVYSRAGDTWPAAGTLAPDDSERGDGFGVALDLDGATAAIVASPFVPALTPPNRAYVFTRDGDGWTQAARLDPAHGDSPISLTNVVLDGDRILIGAQLAFLPATTALRHAAFLFERGATWQQTQFLRPDDVWRSGWEGEAVALAGADVLIGVTNATQLNEPVQGAVYVLRPRAPGEGLVYLPVAAAPLLTQRTGLIAYSSSELGDERSDLFLITPDGRGRTNLTNLSPRHELDPAWSPDGLRLAYVRESMPPGLELVIMDFDDGDEVIISTPGANSLHNLEWSPDGRFIAYDGLRGSGFDVFVVGVDGSPPRNLTDSRATSESNPSWSPDGARIVFWSETHGLATMRPDGSDVTPLVGPPLHFASWPDWSPDGTTILYQQDGDGNGAPDLYVVPAEGGQPRLLLANGRDGHWSPDGTQILFTGASGSLSGGLFRIDADGNNLTVIDRWGHMGDWQP